MTQQRWMLLTIVFGFVAGIAGSVLGGVAVRSRDERAEAPPASTSPVGESNGARIDEWLRDQQSKRLSQLEEKLADKEANDSDERSGQPSTEAHTPPPDLEASREQTLGEWEERLVEHENEPVDPTWSKETQEVLQGEVAGLADQGKFTVVDTKCRSKTCSTTVEWKDYGAAIEGFSPLLHHPYKHGCVREVILPEPENREQPYQATVLYDCSQSRGS